MAGGKWAGGVGAVYRAVIRLTVTLGSLLVSTILVVPFASASGPLWFSGANFNTVWAVDLDPQNLPVVVAVVTVA